MPGVTYGLPFALATWATHRKQGHTWNTNTRLLSLLCNTRGKAQLCSGRQGDGPPSLFRACYCQVSSRGFARVLDKSVKFALVIVLADQRETPRSAHSGWRVFALCSFRTASPPRPPLTRLSISQNFFSA